ncbi:MAG: DUF86 domain-containing protein [Acidobacteriota bacterium]
MSISPVEYLRHILDETDFLANRFTGISKENFLTDETLKRASVRSLEIIGEAVKKVPDDFRSHHSSVDWRAIAGMRDRLVHDYLGVDYDIVWDAIQTKAPALAIAIREIVKLDTGS